MTGQARPRRCRRFRKRIVRGLKMPDIVHCVALYYGVDREALLGRERAYRVARARYMALALCYLLTPNSSVLVGKYFSGRDHTACLHALACVRQRARRKGPVRQELATLRAILKSWKKKREPDAAAPKPARDSATPKRDAAWCSSPHYVRRVEGGMPCPP